MTPETPGTMTAEQIQHVRMVLKLAVFAARGRPADDPIQLHALLLEAIRITR